MSRQDCRDRRSGHPRRLVRAGFTLIELLVVMVIIGILIGLIMVAGQESIRRAEDRASQSLIVKLDSAMNDRLQAIMTSRTDPNAAHQAMASVYPTGVPPLASGSPYYLPSVSRTYTIATFDRIKAELPDVFIPQANNFYPINYSALPYNGIPAVFPATGSAVPFAQFILPLGNAIISDPNGIYGFQGSYGAWSPGPNLSPLYDPAYNLTGTGIFGATYAAASGINKQLGYYPIGYDGVDNNGDGMVDDLKNEGTNLGQDNSVIAKVQASLANHTHNTARAEMLYALLIEGGGPLGSTLNRDDFTDAEVQDTDGDGLLEFVDAWHQPIQFYRWPIFYHSDIQYGGQPYLFPSQPRQQDPLDPNQQLVSPVWWSSQINGNSPSFLTGPAGGLSAGATSFQAYFHLIMDPTASWDRSGNLPSRAYFTKYLILSGGRDKVPGPAVLTANYPSLNPNITDGSGAGISLGAIDSLHLNLVENQAAQVDPVGRSGIFFQIPAGDMTDSYLQTMASGDDVSNQNIKSSGGGIQ